AIVRHPTSKSAHALGKGGGGKPTDGSGCGEQATLCGVFVFGARAPAGRTTARPAGAGAVRQGESAVDGLLRGDRPGGREFGPAEVGAFRGRPRAFGVAPDARTDPLDRGVLCVRLGAGP